MKTSDQQLLNILENDLRSRELHGLIGPDEEVICKLLAIIKEQDRQNIELKNKLGYCQIIPL
jgi:hypothetical protein